MSVIRPQDPDEGGGRIFRNPFVWAFFIGVITLTLIRPLLRFEPDPPPVIGRVPAFSLVDQGGDEFGSSELAGEVYVASFFFTRCPSICPKLMQAMSGLQDRYSESGVNGIRLVSITVDPANDTPDRLGDYASLHGVDPESWSLLTGDPEEIRKLIMEGFKTPMGLPTEIGEGLYDIAHTGKVVLVDRSGGIRGYYGSDEPGLDEIFHRSRHVLKEGR